jgi:hypothetical protein
VTNKRQFKRRIGNPPKHGADALVYRKEIIEQYPELVRYARECHAGLVADLAPEGEDTLSTAKQIILARLTSKILTAGLLDIYLGKNGVIRRDRLDQRVLECEPAVQVWLQVNNAIRRDLETLGLERRQLEPRVLTPAELLAEVAGERADTPAQAQDTGGPEIEAPGATGEAVEGQGQEDGDDE